MTTIALGEVASINPRGERVKATDVVSFVGMAELNAETAVAQPLEDREFAEVSKGYTVFRDGDVLAAKITPCWENGKVGQARLDHPIGVGSTEFHVLRPTSSLDHRYLLHFLRQPSVRATGELRMTGSAGQRRVPVAFLQELQIPLPPLPEQRRIAAILDHADALRAKRRQVLTHLEALIRSTFRAAFADVSETSRLGDLATTTSGGTPNRSVSSNYGGGIPWVKSGELHAGLVTETEETISAQGLSSSSAKVFPAGTVLLAMYGATAGVVGRLGVDAATNQAICAITPGPSLDADYLIAALRAQAVQLVAKAAGGAQPNLSQGIVRDIDIPVPSLDDQKRFASQAAAIDARRSDVVHAKALDDDLFASLQSRAFRGEL
ncbi:restriction endonuclease subunit S [Janibacter sp. G56]|uniref:restriction endonuclease subunit S n=1 Tax=Janibacter sp. G56 TaxID=3418717 RepID=UPI003D0803EA